MAETNPTTAEVRQYLVADNGWTDEEVDNLFGYFHPYINQDGSTNASRDDWSFMAASFE